MSDTAHETKLSEDMEESHIERPTPEKGRSVHNESGVNVDVKPKLHWRTWLVLFAGCFCWMGINWGVSATGFWSSYTVADIGGANIALWYGEGYLVSQVAITPIFGVISDFSPFARKYCVVFLLTVAAIGTFVVGSAQHLYRQGIVGICLYGCGLVAYGPIAAIISDVFPHRMRGFTAGCLYASVSLGGFMADVAGGAMIANGPRSAWRWNLYISGALMLTGASLVMMLYKPLPRAASLTDTFSERMVRFDWLGAALFAFTVLPFMMALIWGGNTYPWDTAAPIACLTIAGVMFISLVLHQLFIKKDGIFHRGLFKNRNYPIAVGAIFIEGFVYITLNIFLGQQIGNLYETRPVFLGLHFGVILITSSFSSLGWGIYCRYTREVKIPLVSAFIVFAACAAGFSRLQPGNHDAAAYGLCALIGIGFGAPQGLLITVGQLAVDTELVGLATSHIISLRSLGGATGAAIATAIFTPKITAFLPDRVASYAAQAGVPADQIAAVVTAVLTDTTGVPTVAGVSPAQIAAAQAGKLKAYADAFSFVYYSIIPWACLAAAALCCLRSVKEAMSWKIDRAVEKDQDLHIDGEYQQRNES